MQEGAEVTAMRLIDGDEARRRIVALATGLHSEVLPVDTVMMSLAQETVVDAVSVVRCKDCEHAERYERTDETAGYYCGHPQNSFTYGERWDRVFKPVKEADGFCSYGERRSDDG